MRRVYVRIRIYLSMVIYNSINYRMWLNKGHGTNMCIHVRVYAL